MYAGTGQVEVSERRNQEMGAFGHYKADQSTLRAVPGVCAGRDEAPGAGEGDRLPARDSI